MIRFREWYEGKDQSESWALKQAMLTVNNAAPTKSTITGDAQEDGCVTWLRWLDSNGKPMVADIQCPLTNVPGTLQGKDWTRYEGLLHTDHAVREEFFLDREIAPTSSRPYLMDFTYLYDDRQEDFEKFTAGKLFTEEEIYAEIGQPQEWTYRATPTVAARSDEQAASVAEQLLICRQWESDSLYDNNRDEEL